MKHGSVLLFVLGVAVAAAQAPDNSKTNQRDRNDRSATADHQHSMSKADTDLVRKIRKALIADKTLSTYAHNVKILAQNGKVTLRGPVRNNSERDSIQHLAAAIAGQDKIVNQLDVAPSKSN